MDRQVARVTIEASSGDAKAVAAGPVDVHTTIPAGGSGRVLRLADTADEAWAATLDGRPLTPTTVDGWAQGFQLPVDGGRLDVTFDAPVSHTGWLWAQGSLAVVLVVLALPGRRRDVDDDLPDEPVAVPAQDITGDGRRARRLRAQAEAEAEAEAEQSADPDLASPPEDVPAAATVPPQHGYGMGVPPGEDVRGWGRDTAHHAGAGAEYGQYDQQYQGAQQYPAGTYDQQHYQADPYQGGQYDPYASYGGDPASYDQTYTQGYDATYDPSHDTGTDSERPDGSQQ